MAKQYRITTSAIRTRHGRKVMGDVLMLTDAELSAIAGLVEPVKGAAQSEEPESEEPESEPTSTTPLKPGQELELSIAKGETRQAELDGMGWRELKEIAEGYDIAKPENGSWEDTIPMILEKEGLA